MSETKALKKPFVLGALAVVIGIIFLMGLLATVVLHTDDRPEGVAERWLTAVSDLTRKGVHDDAAKRVAGHGDLALGQQLVDGVSTDGKSAFTALEVGKAHRTGDTALVPAEFITRGDESHTHQRVLVLQRASDSWRVVELRSADPALRVPSEGGEVAAKAPLVLYAIALAIGVGIAAGAAALVRAAGREHEELLSAA